MANDLHTIQWFPGHMAKTRRLIAENLRHVNLVAEIVDARIPASSRNPEIDALVGEKPRLLLLNKSDLADEAATRRWIEWYRGQGIPAIAIDAKNGRGLGQFKPAVLAALEGYLQRRREKGMTGHQIRVMVVGVPVELALIDGNRCPPADLPCQAVVQGDARSASIAAASILAKVTRDRLMLEYDQLFPGYGFARHKGYPTKAHYCLLYTSDAADEL